MNREQLIEKAAGALHTYCPAGYRVGGQPVLYHGARVHDADARAVIDAILPQVTTVEELEALPDDTVLVRDEAPHLFRLGSRISRHFASKHLPLTVVWTPGGAA